MQPGYEAKVVLTLRMRNSAMLFASLQLRGLANRQKPRGDDTPSAIKHSSSLTM